MNIVELQNVRFVRQGHVILDDVSWTIADGEHWALLGANGAGKTTLLKILTGYEWSTSGTVRILGNEYGRCNVPEVRKAIGWVSSSIMLRFPSCSTALEVVESGFDASVGVYRPIDHAESGRAVQALRHFGVEAMAEQNYWTLSQGEQQRVLIARALVNQPSLIILDEACAGLDPGARETFLEDLHAFALRDDAPTMLFVTHHIEEISSWISKTLVLKEGRVFASGNTEQVLCDDVMSTAMDFDCRVTRMGARFWLLPATD